MCYRSDSTNMFKWIIFLGEMLCFMKNQLFTLRRIDDVNSESHYWLCSVDIYSPSPVK